MATRLGALALFIGAGLVGCSDRNAPVQQIPWAPSFPLGLETAAEEDREVFLFFHASWCTICQRMKANLFHDPEVVAALEAYVPIAVDVDRAPHVARRYLVDAVPSLLVLNQQGQVLARTLGDLGKGELLAFLAPHG